MRSTRFKDHYEYGARVGSFLYQSLSLQKEPENERKKRKNPRFAYLACSVEQILELARTGTININNRDKLYVVPASEISPEILVGSDIAQAVINHPSQTERDTVVAIVNEPALSNNLNRNLVKDEQGNYFLKHLNQLEYFDLAGIQAVTDKAKKLLAPFKEEVLFLPRF